MKFSVIPRTHFFERGLTNVWSLGLMVNHWDKKLCKIYALSSLGYRFIDEPTRSNFIREFLEIGSSNYGIVSRTQKYRLCHCFLSIGGAPSPSLSLERERERERERDTHTHRVGSLPISLESCVTFISVSLSSNCEIIYKGVLKRYRNNKGEFFFFWILWKKFILISLF